MRFVGPPENRHVEHPLHKVFKVDKSVYEELMQGVTQSLANLKRSDSDYEFQLTQAKEMLEDFQVYFKTEDYSNLLEVVKTKSAPVRGLPNIGNSCYMNATLQMLLSVKDEILKDLEGNDSLAVSLIRNFLSENGNISADDLQLLQQVVFPEGKGKQHDATDFLNKLLGHCKLSVDRKGTACRVVYTSVQKSNPTLQQVVDQDFDSDTDYLSAGDKAPGVVFLNIKNAKDHQIFAKGGVVTLPTADGPVKYAVVGISQHRGVNHKDAGGHWVADVKREGCWYRFDDMKVSASKNIKTGYTWVLKRIKTSTH